MLTGHLQEERFSANDDASGCANVLEIARALKRMIDDGRLPRPRRDIRFWWVDEISAAEQYFADQPAERAQFLANINQDMVGAKQSAGSRVQFVTRPPASRASFLGDIVESIVESLVQGNTAYPVGRPGAAVAQTGRPVGWQRRTDEQQFSVPCWPGSARASATMRASCRSTTTPTTRCSTWRPSASRGDVHQLARRLHPLERRRPLADGRHAVEAQRRGGGVGGVGAGHGRRHRRLALAGEMVGRGLARIGRDTTTALALARSAGPNARRRAITLVRESAAREQRTLASLRRLAPGADASAIAAALKQLPTPEAAEARVRALLEPSPATASAEATAGKADVPSPASQSRVPALVDDVQGYLDKREKLERPRALHPLMAYEALNFVDGRRSYADIYRAVSAEADAAGSWYYGVVTAEDVTSYLDSAVKAGVVTINEP